VETAAPAIAKLAAAGLADLVVSAAR
jgi:hypothetical protein